jgi:rhodanese-related sulfurtransferase
MAKMHIIPLETLLEFQHNGEPFTLVETLGEDSFAEGHIPGALNIPTAKEMTAEEMSDAATQQGIDRDDPVVVYCASYPCGASSRAAALLLEAGYTNVMDFAGGKAVWQNAGFQLDSQ